MDSMVFLVGLGKLINRIWKKKTYRWLSYAICIITFSTLYDYIHSIITHTIICTQRILYHTHQLEQPQ